MDIPRNHEIMNYYGPDDAQLSVDTPQVVITGVEVNDELPADTAVEEQFDTSVVGVPEIRTEVQPIVEQANQPTTQPAPLPRHDVVPDKPMPIQAVETTMPPESVDDETLVNDVAELDPVSTSSETTTNHLAVTTNDVGGEAGKEQSKGEEEPQEDESLEPSSGGTDNIDPPNDNVGVGAMDEGDDHSESRNPHEGNQYDSDPDRPHEGNLVTHPITGEPTPVREIGDQVHMLVRARELIEQASNPRPEPVAIPKQEVPVRAFDTLMNLQEKAAGWELISEQPTEDGRIVRTYCTDQTNAEFPDRGTSYVAQLSYQDASATVPVSGNLSIVDADGGWPREYYLQANTVPTYAKDQPKVYYDDYPWHEEELGRPERNTEFGLQQAQRMIARAPHVSPPDIPAAERPQDE